MGVFRYAFRRPVALAVAATGVVSGCKGDANPPSGVTLERVLLSPPTASVGLGGQLRFVAAGQMTDGTSIPVTVVYSATGGTISTDGVYQAAAAVGTFRVIARVSGGTFADTADVLVTPQTAHNYSTTFSLTENPISEGGRWINGGTIGRDWTDVSTTPELAIGHQIGASYTDATAILAGPWGPDQRVTASVYTTDPKDPCYQEVEMRLRTSIVPGQITGYEVSFKSSQSASAYVLIVRWNGPLGDFTVLRDTRGTAFGVANGDVVSATVVGNIITAYKNGVQVAQASDSLFTSGSPGMGFNLENAAPGCAGTNGNYGFTSFSATDFVLR